MRDVALVRSIVAVFRYRRDFSLTAIPAADPNGPTPVPRSSLDASAPVGRLVEQTTAAFEGKGMPLARRWARALVAAVLDVPHAELEANAGRRLDPEQRLRFEGIARRASPDVPLAYEIGLAPFLDWDFEVSRHTLIPKVDTELFAGIVFDELSRRPLPPEPRVLELCREAGAWRSRSPNGSRSARTVSSFSPTGP
jgi:PrmC N-terminal domain